MGPWRAAGQHTPAFDEFDPGLSTMKLQTLQIHC
jgi:hypothetical protein